VPTYEYRCKDCGDQLEVVQSFTDDSLTTCESCGGSLRKVFGNVGIAFKGTGFYKNDSRGKAASSSSSNGDKATTDSSSATKDGSKDTKKDATKDTKKDASTKESKTPASSSTSSSSSSS
jgi:putative FmdB family regulatory protein